MDAYNDKAHECLGKNGSSCKDSVSGGLIQYDSYLKKFKFTPEDAQYDNISFINEVYIQFYKNMGITKSTVLYGGVGGSDMHLSNILNFEKNNFINDNSNLRALGVNSFTRWHSVYKLAHNAMGHILKLQIFLILVVVLLGLRQLIIGIK